MIFEIKIVNFIKDNLIYTKIFMYIVNRLNENILKRTVICKYTFIKIMVF